MVTTCNSAGKLTDCEVFCVTEVMFVEICEGHSLDRTAACKKLITQGFSDLHLTACKSDRELGFRMKVLRVGFFFLWLVQICTIINLLRKSFFMKLFQF